MLSHAQMELLRDRVFQLLHTVGIKVESGELTDVLSKKGGRKLPSGRIGIPKSLIDEMVSGQKMTQIRDARDQLLHPRCGIDWTHHLIWNNRQDEIQSRLESQFLMSAFDCGPTKYYDYRRRKVLPVDTEIFTAVKKFAHGTPEIGYISTWYRQDVSPKIERLDSLILGLKLTDKVDGIEAIYPEVIKYLKEASEIITNRPGDSSYLAGSECMTSPLILEKRSAEDILERFKYNVRRYHVASMPTIGVASPVTVAGSIILGAAEILGGMAVCWCVDPGSDLSGRMISMVADMRTGNSVMTGPETTLVNLGVKKLFDAFWGGHLWVEVFFSPSAREPGLAAVFENDYGRNRTARILGNPDIPYPGTGTLGDGAVGSPTQFMLDMEIRKSEFAMNKPVACNENELAYEEITRAIAAGQDFLNSEHTLANFRGLWNSQIFNFKVIDEKGILDKCEEMWRDNLRRYEPPAWPEEKIKALDNLLDKAKKELLG
jgi:trimethylamine:corrinoid methyltransferase-like protein